MGRPAKADRRAAKLGDSNARTARLRACRSSSERPTKANPSAARALRLGPPLEFLAHRAIWDWDV
jgi:hypothetical protein